jgi:hypothetical protein
MNRALILTIARLVTIAAFMVTLSATYYLRSEVLTLNKIRFSADNVRAEDALREMTESHPVRLAEYEIGTKHYELQMDHYSQMLDLYRTNYDEYVKRIKDKYVPPKLPWKPSKPTSPELSDQLGRINAEFRAQQYHYFDSTSRLNWVTCASALVLVGGLLFLTMFETGNQRFLYLVVLVLSFVFMIGPSFHSIMSAIVGLLSAPPTY